MSQIVGISVVDSFEFFSIYFSYFPRNFMFEIVDIVNGDSIFIET